MSTEKGVVEKIENGFAWVRAQRKSACAGCGNRSHCSMIEGGNQMLVKATNVIDAGEGDSVEIHMNSSFQLKCTFVVYIIPVLGIIAGAIVSETRRELSLRKGIGELNTGYTWCLFFGNQDC